MAGKLKTKQCSKCKLIIPIHGFYSRGGNQSHLLSSHCRFCRLKKMVGKPKNPIVVTKQRFTRQRRHKKIIVEMLGGKCIRCGYNRCIAALDFDHIDPSIKIFEVGSHSNYSLKRLIPEAMKCQLLCANCHREKTWYPQDFPP